MRKLANVAADRARQAKIRKRKQDRYEGRKIARGIYYLDLRPLYTDTTKQERSITRKSLTREDRNRIMTLKLKKQHYRCFFCGIKIGINDHLDHLLPIYHGGDNKKSNLVSACKECNLIKYTGQIEISNEKTLRFYVKTKNRFERCIEKMRTLGPVEREILGFRMRPTLRDYKSYRMAYFKHQPNVPIVNA